MSGRGFTLLEVLISIAILAVITSIIYASFDSVINSTDAVRGAMNELRTRKFLTRVLIENFSTVVTDPYFSEEEERYAFIGEDSSGGEGAADTVTFCSSAPLLFGTAFPGDLKIVTLEVDDPESDMTLDMDDSEDRKRHRSLIATEIPMLGAMVEESDGVTGDAIGDVTYEPTPWEMPVRSFNVQYFDGEEWVDEWDSINKLRLPWAVYVRINFVKTEEQLEADRYEGFDAKEDPDFELVIPIPQAMSVTEDSLLTTQLPRGDDMTGLEGGGNVPGGGGGGGGTQSREGYRPGVTVNSGGRRGGAGSNRGLGSSEKSR